jgi:hypothetical protein
MDDGIIGFDDVYENILNLDYISPIKWFIMQSAELIIYKDQFFIKIKDGTINVKVIK